MAQRVQRQRQRFRAAATIAPRYESGVLGLPPGAMVMTNSERRAAWCPRRWWYEYGTGLRGEATGAMRFGTAYHRTLERVLGWLQHHDGELYPAEGLDRCLHCHGADPTCPLCGGTGLGAVEYVATELRRQPEVYEAEDGGVEGEVDRLRRAVLGWLHVYGVGMRDDWQVLATELAVAAPITSPTTGDTYRSRVPVVATADGWRLASAGDSPTQVQEVVLPWFQLAQLDAVVANRRSGNLWLWETKTSASPSTYGENLGLDTQLPGYLRALWYLVGTGKWGEGRQVEGYVWDVAGSGHQRDPKRLASGKLSTDKRQRVPSWVLEQVLQAEDASRYKPDELQGLRDLLQHLRESVDGSLYHREFGHYTAQQLRRYEVELFAEATRLATWRRAVVGTATAEGGTVTNDEQVAAQWHRVPLCRQPGGSCPFTGICQEDSAVGRAVFQQRHPVRWLTADAVKQSNVSAAAAAGGVECPF